MMQYFKKPTPFGLILITTSWLIIFSTLVVMDPILPGAWRIGLISVSAAIISIQLWYILKWQAITSNRDAQLERVTDELQRANTALTQWMWIDIIERQQVENHLIEAGRLETVAVLAAGLAHDFNNILTAILGNVSLAKLYAPKDDKLIKRLSNAENATLRAQDLTRQLLTMAKGGEPDKRLASIRDVVQEAVDFSTRGSNARYELEMAETLWPAQMDTGQISQVIHNLMINADHAMPDGGVIRVSIENICMGDDMDDDRPSSLRALKPGPYIKTTIQDQGVGIEAADLNHIFTPYFTTKQQGHGLGLSTAYAIVNKHNGTIHVESEAGVGTTFHLYLPAAPAQRVMPSTDVEPPIASGTGRILFMEDDETLRDAVGHALDGFGYDVVFVHDGDETLSAYQQALKTGDPFDAIVLDLTIPGGMGGRDTLSQLLAIDPEVKAIVASGYSNHPILAAFQQYGFCGGIAKPYRPEQLHHILHQVIHAEPQAVTTSPSPHQY